MSYIKYHIAFSAEYLKSRKPKEQETKVIFFNYNFILTRLKFIY